MGFFRYIKGFVSEVDGQASSARFCIIATFAFCLGVGTGLFHKIEAHVTVSDFCQYLQAAGMFITTTCTPLFAISKSAEAYGKRIDANANTNAQGTSRSE